MRVVVCRPQYGWFKIDAGFMRQVTYHPIPCRGTRGRVTATQTATSSAPRDMRPEEVVAASTCVPDLYHPLFLLFVSMTIAEFASHSAQGSQDRDAEQY